MNERVTNEVKHRSRKTKSQ